jgi:hypothetical protein
MFLRGLGSWWIALRISSLLILALVSTALEALWQRGYAQSAIVSSSPAPEKPDEKMLTPSPTVPMDPEVTTANSLAVCTKRLEQQSRLLRGSLNFTLRLADTLAECEQTSELTAPNCANKLLSCEASLGKVQMENTGLKFASETTAISESTTAISDSTTAIADPKARAGTEVRLHPSRR